MTACILAAMLRYGSPQDGRNGLARRGQLPGRRSAGNPTSKRSPWKWFHGSISRSSTRASRPNCAATGAAVSCARSSGEDSTSVTSRPARNAAAALAMCSPSGERWNPGSRP